MVKDDKKRIYILLTALIALVAIVFAFSAFGDGVVAYAENDLPVYNATDDVYEISTAEQLVALSNLVNNGTKTNGPSGGSLRAARTF